MTGSIRFGRAVSALAGVMSALLMLSACGKSSEKDDEGSDAEITFDASGIPDASVDGAEGDADVVPDNDIGQSCNGMGDCDEFCIDEGSGFPGGYCTAPCGPGADCPNGTTCTPVGRGQSICLAACGPAGGERRCRDGYGCSSSPQVGPVCLPGCELDSDCPAGQSCDPTGGFAGAGTCFDPNAMVGSPCTDDDMCPPMGFCLDEGDQGWPAGACVTFGCDAVNNAGCAGDAVCLPTNGGNGSLCVDGCSTSADCRAGYACIESQAAPGRMYCGPGCTDNSQCSGGRECNQGTGQCTEPFPVAELGQACSTVMGACEGGACLREFESGFPGSYCLAVGCDPDAPVGMQGCPGDGLCLEGGGGGLCVDGCSVPADCTRAGYTCRNSDRSDPASPTACLPQCSDDSQCANMGFQCNEGTGLCRAPFSAGDLGTTCNNMGGCDGGRCIDEEDDGWPGGTCTFPGCRLSGTGPSEDCPTGSACIDDGTGDPAIGVCVETCTVGMAATCRAGYDCIGMGTGMTGTCEPRCQMGDCSGGRSCNVMTGLCE